MLADNGLFLTNSVWSSDINDGSSFSKHKASVLAIFSTQQLVEKLIWARGFFFPLLRIRKPCISKHRKGHGWLPQIYSLSQNSQGVLGTESPSSTLCSPYYWSRVCNYEAAILPGFWHSRHWVLYLRDIFCIIEARIHVNCKGYHSITVQIVVMPAISYKISSPRQRLPVDALANDTQHCSNHPARSAIRYNTLHATTRSTVEWCIGMFKHR